MCTECLPVESAKSSPSVTEEPTTLGGLTGETEVKGGVRGALGGLEEERG